MSDLIHVFPCQQEGCRGTAIPLAKDGRFYAHPTHGWLFVCIPAHFLIHRCSNCGRDWLTEPNQKLVNDFLEESFQEHASLIRGVVDAARAKAKAEADAKK